jgi:prevent-host-death family protein
MAKFNCVDCGTEIESKVKKPYNRRCPACTETSGPMGPSSSGFKVIREEVGVRELKANPTELIHMLEETPGLEIIITRYGKPAAKLVSLKETSEEIPWEDRISLRGTWAHMHELTDEDFAEAKKIWEPRIDV